LQTVPQAPQLLVSLVVSTQDAPQLVLGPQFGKQAPDRQTVPLPQATPHPPQFAGSEPSSTH
jgi:hypothetical protein